MIVNRHLEHIAVNEETNNNCLPIVCLLSSVVCDTYAVAKHTS